MIDKNRIKVNEIILQFNWVVWVIKYVLYTRRINCSFFLFAGSTMEGPEITFLFQFGNLRDTVTVAVSTLNLRSFKDLACDFINSKVHVFFNT